MVIGTFSTVTKKLVKGLEDLEIRTGEETIQTTMLLGSARIPRRVLEIWGDLLLLRIQGRTIKCKKNYQMNKIVSRSCQRTEKAVDKKVIVITIEVGALGTVPKGLEKILGELLWTPSHGRAKTGWPARTLYTTALCRYRKTSREQWTIETGGERGPERFMLAVWHDDDDDMFGLNLMIFYVSFFPEQLHVLMNNQCHWRALQL